MLPKETSCPAHPASTMTSPRWMSPRICGRRIQARVAMKGCKEQSPGVLLQMLDLGGSHQLLGVPRLIPVGEALEPRPPEEVPRGG